MVRAWGLLILIVDPKPWRRLHPISTESMESGLLRLVRAKKRQSILGTDLGVLHIAAFWVLVAVYKAYIAQVLQMRWRNWLNTKFS